MVLKRAVLKFGKKARIKIVTIKISALSWKVPSSIPSSFDFFSFPFIFKCRVALLVSVTEHGWREERVK